MWNYFGQAREGFFVDVGANHPFVENQTWFLEQQGWRGILIEPHPDMAALLRDQRPRSKTLQVVVVGPAQVGSVDFHLAAGPAHSAVNPAFDVVLSGRSMHLPSRTLDSVLAEAELPQVDFLSLDVEGMELDALDGFDLQKWQPRLLLIEDFFYDHRKHAYLCQRGYKLVKRTGYNNWYVPRSARASVFSLNSFGELFSLFRKMWFSGPLIGVRRALRRRLKRSKGQI